MTTVTGAIERVRGLLEEWPDMPDTASISGYPGLTFGDLRILLDAARPVGDDAGLVEELICAQRGMAALPTHKKQAMEDTTDFSANACAHLFGQAAARIQSLSAQPSEEIVALQHEVELIRMGADYTGLSKKTHAMVPMDLLERLDAALTAMQKKGN